MERQRPLPASVRDVQPPFCPGEDCPFHQHSGTPAELEINSDLGTTLTSVAIALVIVAGTWGLFRQSLHLLFDGVPESVILAEVDILLRALPGSEVDAPQGRVRVDEHGTASP